MSNYSYHLERILPPLSTAMAILSLGNGLYSLVNPQGASNMIGIPVASFKSPALPFISFSGARNISGGLTLLALLYTGQKKAIGTTFMCGTVTAALDAWIISNSEDAEEGKAIGHAIMAVVVGLLGVGMYWGGDLLG